MRNGKYVVFQIITSTLSGQGRLTHDLLRALPEEEFECHVAYTRGPLMDAEHDYRFGSQWEVLFHGVMTRLTDRQGFYSKRATRQLIEYMDSQGVDLVHLHHLHGYYLHLPTLFGWLRERKLPVVWMQHDCWNFTGHCTYFSSIGCEKWRGRNDNENENENFGCCHCPLRRDYTASFVDASAMNYADKQRLFNSLTDVNIVTPSNWLKSLVLQSFLGCYPVTCIHNGINLEVFRRKTKSTENPRGKRYLLGLAASFTNPVKGYGDFLRLRTMLPSDYLITLVGVSAKQKRSLPDGIIGIEHTQNVEQLVDIYNQADHFLNLTSDDNFPTTNIEAMACGTPVLTYRTGGSPDALTPETGYVVRQGDLERVRDIVLAHHKTEATVRACTERARQFDRETIYHQYLELYRKMLNDHGFEG